MKTKLDLLFEQTEREFVGKTKNDAKVEQFNEVVANVQQMLANDTIISYSISNENDDPSARVEILLHNPEIFPSFNYAATLMADSFLKADRFIIRTREEDNRIVVVLVVDHYWFDEES